ncbi:MAG: YcgN family cysteine cluster protein, partial [Pseudomonadota bacterium]|nr:YcgN family cysteine cluster protein [Pseudomonadota bacterium]
MTINFLNKNDEQSDLHSGVNPAGKLTQSVSLFPNTDSRSEPLRPQFWSRFALNELNHSEWEALCDGCG